LRRRVASLVAVGGQVGVGGADGPVGSGTNEIVLGWSFGSGCVPLCLQDRELRCQRLWKGRLSHISLRAGTLSARRRSVPRAGAAGADAVLAIMDEREENGTEPPNSVAAALSGCDVFIAPTSKSLSHTVARKEATDGGARGATMPGVTEDMLARVMSVDFDAMTARSSAVAELLTKASSAHLTCPLGSDLTLGLTGREGIADDGVLSARGAFGNLPCGEGFIAPLSGDGRIVAISLASIGLTEPPAALTVREGNLVDAEGGRGPELLDRLRAHGDAGTNVAELGVGTNDQARL